MTARHAFLFAAALALLTAPALGDPAQLPAPHHHHHDRAGKLTPEQKLMLRAEMRDQMHSMPRDQRKAFHQQMKAQWKSMDASARQQKIAELDQRWNAMPADQRMALMAKAEERRKRHAENRKNHGGKHKHDATE